MDLGNISKKEKDLAQKLRRLCTPLLDEKMSTLSASTDMLHRMGRLYVRKAEITEGMDQKLNFIKAATLLHGARVRSEIFLKNSWKTTGIIQSLNQMQILLMRKCSGSLSSSLLEISQHVLATFETYRDEEKKRLDALEIIDEAIPKGKLDLMREEKVDIIQNLLKSNSEKYKSEMSNLAECCIKILGPPPCDFTIVGLGSLARSEVTLYSDFEHVIILDQDKWNEQHRQACVKVLEYFRWFSVVFHIIVIGMGETIIPSIGIESLNDFYTDDKTKNWFYDSFTPSGISFDGMMPHACKIPIGRQKETKKKDFIIELIKPVSHMASYLTNQQDIKNEYCLKDVLSEACFVFGSQDLFTQFQEKSDEILGLEHTRNSSVSISTAAKENSNPYVGNREMLATKRSAVDAKFTFYRPISVLIEYCYLYFTDTRRTGGKSGFEKIMLLENQPSFGDSKSLLWAFAVACEIRLKVYAASKGNRVKYVGRDSVKFVGKQCLVNCASTIADLSAYLTTISPRQKVHQFQHLVETKAYVLMFLEDFTTATDAFLELIKKSHIYVPYSDSAEIGYKILYAVTCFMSISRPNSILGPKHLKEAEEMLVEIKDYHRHPVICHTLMKIYQLQNRQDEAKKIARLGFENLKEKEEDQEHEAILFEIAEECMEPVEFINFHLDFLLKRDDISPYINNVPAIARAQCKLGAKTEAKQLLKHFLKERIYKYPTRVSLYRLVECMDTCFMLQYRQEWYNDCIETLEMFEEITESSREYIDITGYAQNLYSSAAIITYLMAGVVDGNRKSASEKTRLYEKAVEICKKSEYRDSLQPLYCTAVMLLLSHCRVTDFREIDMSKLYHVFADAPRSFQDDSSIKATAVISFHNLFITLLESSSSGPMEILHKVVFSCRIMRGLDPFLYPIFFELQDKVRRQLIDIFPESLPPFDFNSMATKTFSFRLAMNLLWISLRQVERYAAKKTFSRFLGYLNNFLCISTFKHFSSYWETLPFRLSPDVDFRYAVEDYCLFYFDSAKVFWKIMHGERKRSFLQKLSIEFLCSAILHFFSAKLGYRFYTDRVTRQISAGPPEIVEQLQLDDSGGKAFLAKLLERKYQIEIKDK